MRFVVRLVSTFLAFFMLIGVGLMVLVIINYPKDYYSQQNTHHGLKLVKGNSLHISGQETVTVSASSLEGDFLLSNGAGDYLSGTPQISPYSSDGESIIVSYYAPLTEWSTSSPWTVEATSVDLVLIAEEPFTYVVKVDHDFWLKFSAKIVLIPSTILSLLIVIFIEIKNMWDNWHSIPMQEEQ